MNPSNVIKHLTPADERYALAHASVPEHIPSLMTAISHATPFLLDGYLGFAKANWIIFVGYPLTGDFDPAHCEQTIARVVQAQRPEYLWFIGAEIPPCLASTCRARESDQYLRLDLAHARIPSALRREVNQAAQTLRVERTHAYTREHRALADELMRRQTLAPMVAELYRAMPAYVAHSPTACVLNARDARNKLAAFYVVELAAEQFDTYVLGGYSKKNYTPHASDLLFWEMIQLARERNKPAIHLGLGVNEGIRRFKTKWGGVPFLPYEFCECNYGSPKQTGIVDWLCDGKR